MLSARAGAAEHSSNTRMAGESLAIMGLAIMSFLPQHLCGVLHAFCGSLDRGKAAHSLAKRETLMTNETRPVDRRSFLGGSAMALVGLSGTAQAQEAKPGGQKADAETAKPTHLLTDFIAGFDLKHAPPLAIERARTAFIDTMGVTLAGSRSAPAALMLEMVTLEGATPTASIVGQSLRTSPQLAALANGVASHALDFDFTYTQGPLVAPVIPALLPLAEATRATPPQTLA